MCLVAKSNPRSHLSSYTLPGRLPEVKGKQKSFSHINLKNIYQQQKMFEIKWLDLTSVIAVARIKISYAPL